MAPKFQQRHYEALAKVLQGVREDCTPEGAKDCSGRHMDVSDVIDHVVACLAAEFRHDNSLFNSDRFRHACQPGANVKARKVVA